MIKFVSIRDKNLLTLFAIHYVENSNLSTSLKEWKKWKLRFFSLRISKGIKISTLVTLR